MWSFVYVNDPEGWGGFKILYLYLYVYWQNVLGTHHASAHGGSFGLVVKMLV